MLRHEIITDARISELIAEAKQTDLNDVERANLQEIARAWRQASLLPVSLVDAKSLAGSRCEHAWREQRPANDWQGFAANLKEVVCLSREEAQLRAEAAGTSRYDALLDLYKSGMTSARLDETFGELKSWLPDLLQQVVAKQAREKTEQPKGPFPDHAQRELGLSVMETLGFDFRHGRLDVIAHPFCGGVPEDVRITTRYNQQEFLSALMGLIHETGHARCEQGLPEQWHSQPAGLACSTSIHESQSLFMEMQLGRSREFLQRILPQVTATLGDQPALQADNFVRLTQRVQPGFIRVDADELSYPAHVILRFEIEDIPALWE
nr:carboxypeptidase M33 [Candidatus Pantoea persica]